MIIKQRQKMPDIGHTSYLADYKRKPLKYKGQLDNFMVEYHSRQFKSQNRLAYSEIPRYKA